MWIYLETGLQEGSLQKYSKLQYFNVSQNLQLGGMLPSQIWSSSQLQNFSASACNISGKLPEFITCKTISGIELDGNHFSGTIPKSIAKCKAIEKMSLANNNLTGNIPVDLSSLPSLSMLDMSNNKLKGHIPVEFGNSSSLVLLNVSFNDVSGSIPSTKNFRLMGADAFIGNPKLCGAPLQSCSGSKENQNRVALKLGSKSSEKLTWISLLCAVVVLFILIAILGIFYFQREKKGGWKMVSFTGLPRFTPNDVLRSFSYNDLMETAPSVTPSVCKAVLPTGITVSVKKIEWDAKRKVTMAEYLTRIGNARHKNLVRLLGLCSNKHFSFLLYDYLPSGNLEEKMRMKGESTTSWEAKYTIVMGIARGLCYLHHDCYPAIPHGDLKASTIMFDENMEPLLAEFGLKTLIQMNGGFLSGGISNNASVEGTGELNALVKEELCRDIYCFGKVLLEILTNGRLTNMEQSVQSKPRESILREIYEENSVGSTEALREEIESVLEVALLCTRGRPSERPSMNDALKLLLGSKSCKSTSEGQGL